MKKKLFLIFALVVLTAFVFAEVKIGIINPEVVLQNSAKGKEAIERLKSMKLSEDKKGVAMQKEITDMEKEITISSSAMNPEARDKKTLDLQSKRVELKRFVEDYNEKLSAAQRKELEPIQRALMPIIEKIAKGAGFSLVLDVNTAGVTYFDPAIDITEQVIKAYDAQVPSTVKK